MSETTSAPAAPAAAPAAPAPAPAPAPATDRGDVIAGPARDQAALSVSEAARLLNRQRREAGEPASRANPPAQPAAAPPGRVNPLLRDKADGNAPGNSAITGNLPSAADAGAAQAAPGAAEAMARALGVPVDAQAAADGASEAPIEFDGRRYAPAELRTMLSQGADYTKKTQALAEQTRQVQAQAQALAQVLPIIQPEIARLQAALQDVPAPDMALIETNPQEYLRQQSRWQAALQEQQRLATLGNMQSEAQARAQQQQVDAANQELAREFPQWGDPKQRSAWQQEIVDWALAKGGYSRDDLRGLTDARHLRTMMKAMQFDRWVGGARTQAPPSAGMVVRGTAPPPAPTAQVQRAESAFDARPSVRAGAALLAARRGTNGVAR